MALVFDDRARVATGRGLHAFIVGVGSYPFLKDGASAVADPWEMGQLTSTASSAYKIYQWLRGANDAGRLPVPLVSCRLLLSPTAAEPTIAGIGEAATLAKFAADAKDWRTDCSGNRDSIAFFYFAGHGMQRTNEDSVLCLEEFRQPLFGNLVHSIALANLRGGMAPSPQFPNIGRTQLYFIDACRTRPEDLSKFEEMSTTPVFDPSLAGQDDRSSPIFYAAISNRATAAIAGQQTLFSRALIDCLDGEAGEAIGTAANGDALWGVTTISLNQQLDSFKIDQLNRQFQADQTYAPGGQFRERTICTLGGAPPVQFRLEVDPPGAAQFARVTLSSPPNPAVFDISPPITPYPYRRPVPGGIYQLQISFEPPHAQFQQRQLMCVLRPAQFSQKIRVIP